MELGAKFCSHAAYKRAGDCFDVSIPSTHYMSRRYRKLPFETSPREKKSKSKSADVSARTSEEEAEGPGVFRIVTQT